MHRLVIALTTLIGLTGAAVVAGYLFLFAGSSDRAATLAPASTALYLNVYLEPSAGQQMNLAGLIGRLPGFADEASLDSKVDQIVENLLADTGIDYRADVKPWLGDQLAIAAWPSPDDATQPEGVVIAEVRDPDAARTAIAGLVADGATFESRAYSGVDLEVSDAGAYAFVGDMLVFGERPEGIEAIVDVQGGADSLAARSDFRDAMSRVPSDHLASVFVDLGAFAESAGVEGQLDKVTTASAALVAEPDGLRLSGSAPLAAEPSASAGATDGGAEASATLPEWMPSNTLAEVVVFGLRDTLEKAEAAIGAAPQGEDVSSALDTLRALAAFGLGLDLDADVLPLLDREVGVAITGFDGDVPSGVLLLRPTDAGAAGEAINRIASRLSAIGGSITTTDVDGTQIATLSIPDTADVAFAVADGVVVIGLSSDDVAAAISAHADGSSLVTSDAYARTFQVAGTRAGTEAYVDVGELVDLAGGTVNLPDDARDILAQLGAFGLTLPARADQIEFHAVLTIDEPTAE